MLDYVPSRDMHRWKDRDYFDALNRRINREVLIETPMARPAKDEAVLVIPPQEWRAMQGAREREVLQEAELEQARDELDAVREREGELQKEVEDLQDRLSGLHSEDVEQRRVALKLVGVRRAQQQGAPLGEAETPAFDLEPAQPAEPAWEVVEDDGTAVPSAEELRDQGWDLVDDEPQERSATEAAIREVEEEIQRIEGELEDLAQKQDALGAQTGPDEPFTFRDYQLYRRETDVAGRNQTLFYFSRDDQPDADPSALPPGYEVAVNARSGLPYLRKVKTGKKASATKKAAKRSTKKRSGSRKTKRKKSGKRSSK